MNRKLFLLSIVILFSFHLKGQKDLPAFTQYGECFLNSGKCDEVVVKESIAYIGTHAGLLILDISDPVNPEFVSCYYTDKFVYNIFISDTLAFVVSAGLWDPVISIINISNLFDPTLINSFEVDGYQSLSIFVTNHYLFLGMSSGLQIFDLSDLLNPIQIIHLPDIDPEDMIVRDDFIYMVANYNYFGILDITNITEPEMLCWIGDYSTNKNVIDLNWPFIFIGGKSFEIFYIGDPSNPNQVSELEINEINDLQVDGNTCYLISSDSMYVINVYNLVSPEILDNYSYAGSHLGYENNILVVSKDFDYEEPIGIGIFEINEGSQIDLNSEFITDEAKEVFVEGNYAYVANGYNGLKIINVAVSSNPITVSNCMKEYYVIESIIENSIAYVRTKDGLKIVDIINPELPFTISGFDLFTGYTSANYVLEKYGDYVFLGGNFSDIYIVDVSDPFNPYNAGIIDVNDWSPDIEIFEDRLYVAGYWGGLQIFDLSNPINPSMVGYYPLGLALKIAVGNEMAFVGGTIDGNSSGAEIFDLSVISNPIHTGTYEIGGPDMQCINNHLIAVNRTYQDINSSILIINMNDLYNPILEQEVMHIAPNGIFYKDDKIYVVEDYKFKIYGDSLTVSNNDQFSNAGNIGLSCFPNPAKYNTTIRFTTNQIGNILLAVYSISGEIIDILVHRKMSAGIHNIYWDLENNLGEKVIPGIYLISIQSDTFQVSKKIIVSNK